MGRFTERIPDLTWDLFLGRLYQNRPSAFRWRSKAESIERLCDRLAKSLEIQGNDPQTIPIEIYKFLKFFAEPQGKDTGDTKTRTREKFQTALASVPLLREWARIGIDHTSRSVEKGKISGKSRRAPDLALQEFYEGLGRVLLDVFGGAQQFRLMLSTDRRAAPLCDS